MMPRRLLQGLLLGSSLFFAAAAPRDAGAFCGFYVSGADAKLFNNATMVVLLRDGTKTVLSMQNNYQGPPEDFAMVVPVPVVLQKDNVKTLDRNIFDRVDKLAAPRLVEYWEQDPCPPPPPETDDDDDDKNYPSAPMMMEAAPSAPRDYGVKIEAQFAVGEYDIVILSAQDSMGLDAYLRDNKYKIPDGAEAVLRPYVQSGMKFFVAKVNSKKVQFQNGMATLSPLRFHYDSETFSLPVRLGLLNSGGTQDLIVHILAKEQRYEVANYPNVTIPTNLNVAEAARDQFGPFYASLFDRTLQQHKNAVITEYSWAAESCDPCPSPALTPEEVMTLGGDVIAGKNNQNGQMVPSNGLEMQMPAPPFMQNPWQITSGMVLTRLHARYDKSSLGEDLVFKAAPAIQGGREVRDAQGQLEKVATAASYNNFQGRYAIRHPWVGAIPCSNPQRGIWGGPPPSVEVAGDTSPKAATNLAFVARGASLESFLAQDVPEISVQGSGQKPAGWSINKPGGACACLLAPEDDGGTTAVFGAAMASIGAAIALGLRRRLKNNQNK